MSTVFVGVHFVCCELICVALQLFTVMHFQFLSLLCCQNFLHVNCACAPHFCYLLVKDFMRQASCYCTICVALPIPLQLVLHVKYSYCRRLFHSLNYEIEM